MRFWFVVLNLAMLSVAAAQSTSPEQAFSGVEEIGDGLGPRFNLDSCGGCHAHPSVGGSSPATNPQVALAKTYGNRVPPFITVNGPIREVRFRRDSQVHQLFVISGHKDAAGCNIDQPDFQDTSNLTFRIPTPLFGTGDVESIPDEAIRANLQQNPVVKRLLGIAGRVSEVNGHVGRFGWKSQHFSLEQFAGEAYNVEMGITSRLAPDETDQTKGCQFADVPNSPADPHPDDVTLFTEFMRALPPPPPVSQKDPGFAIFQSTGCDACHTPALQGSTGEPVRLFSDLALHDMGPGLADGIIQGAAGPREFRTAPLWGVGQRLFFLHDGRTRDLEQAVLAHQSLGSEASSVIERFRALTPANRQTLLDFLRAL